MAELLVSLNRDGYVAGLNPNFAWGWLVVLRIYVASVVFQPYLDLETGDNQSLKMQVARQGMEPGPLA